MPSKVSRTDILTDDEQMDWHHRDHVEFYAWYARMVNVDISEAQGKKDPRHRYNTKYPHMP